MDLWVSVDFGSGCLEYFRFGPLGKPQHIDRTHYGGLCGLDRVELVMYRRRGAGKVIDLVHFYIQGKGHVMAQEFKIGIIEQMNDILFVPGEKVIGTDDLVPLV
jgi:hypothetical protein